MLIHLFWAQFLPPIVRGDKDKLATFVVPGAGGGANFPGASFDPETGILYVPSATRPHGMSLIQPPEGTSDWPLLFRWRDKWDLLVCRC